MGLSSTRIPSSESEVPSHFSSLCSRFLRTRELTVYSSSSSRIGSGSPDTKSDTTERSLESSCPTRLSDDSESSIPVASLSSLLDLSLTFLPLLLFRLATHYVEGLSWVLHYYYQGVRSNFPSRALVEVASRSDLRYSLIFRFARLLRGSGTTLTTTLPSPPISPRSPPWTSRSPSELRSSLSSN